VDIPRDPVPTRRKRLIQISVAVAVFATITIAVARLEPAAPSVDRAAVWTDSVKRGTMIRQVRGPGTLVPEQIRYIAAVTAGRVERVHAQPGVEVDESTVLLELSNPDLDRQTLEAQRQLTGSEADYANLSASLENQRLSQEAAVASARSAYREAERQAKLHEEMAERGLIATMDLSRARDAAEEQRVRLEIEQKRLEFMTQSMRAQLTAQRSQIERLRGIVEFHRQQIESMVVRAGTVGVLRELPLQEGQWVIPGSNLAVVVQPGRLKAELRIPETQARDLTIGQESRIDTRNGVVSGRVVRIDPAVQGGTVRVDVALYGALPRGARPDLSVDGIVEIERLDDVLYVGRPAYGQPESAVRLFRLEPGGASARSVTVRLGRSSVNTIEIIDGLAEGDVVILSDMSTWDAAERVRLR
jgi:HlyD family secretion protein